jgi:hypothetical protein
VNVPLVHEFDFVDHACRLNGHELSVVRICQPRYAYYLSAPPSSGKESRRSARSQPPLTQAPSTAIAVGHAKDTGDTRADCSGSRELSVLDCSDSIDMPPMLECEEVDGKVHHMTDRLRQIVSRVENFQNT